MAHDILLESGTNEMELLVFALDSTPFGINVAKVREIVQQQKTIAIPHAPYAIEGSFKLRDKILTLVNLGRHFDMEGEQTKKGDGSIIVIEFNNIVCGILVDTVERIYRLHWDQIEPPSEFLTNMNVPITGITRIDERIVLVADFETIVSQILGAESAPLPTQTTERISRKDVRIILADDSSIIRTNLIKILNQNGFENLTVCNDGQEVWETLDTRRTEPGGPCDIVLTDIEMPRMDGLHLTARIKEDPQLKDIPVVLFSSLITEDNIQKGKSVGADAQVSKPDSQQMIQAIEDCVMKNQPAPLF
jgi:two-component system chemotaxis response regulator CheV